MVKHDKALVTAVGCRDLKGAKAALAAGASPDARDTKGEPVLHLALIDSSRPLVRLLVERGANVNLRGRKRQTPLQVAREELPDVVGVLIAAGATPDRGDLAVMMHQAVLQSKLAQVEELLARRVPLDVRDEDGNTPLHSVLGGSGRWGMTSKDTGVALWLIKAGADVNARGEARRTPLHRAASDHGAGKVADRKVLAALFARGAKLTTDAYGNTPLHESMCNTHGKHDWLWALLLRKGVALNARNRDGETALYTAVVHWNVHAVKYLLRNGADPRIANRERMTPLAQSHDLEQHKIIPLLEAACA